MMRTWEYYYPEWSLYISHMYCDVTLYLFNMGNYYLLINNLKICNILAESRFCVGRWGHNCGYQDFSHHFTMTGQRAPSSGIASGLHFHPTRTTVAAVSGSLQLSMTMWCWDRLFCLLEHRHKKQASDLANWSYYPRLNPLADREVYRVMAA